MLGFRVLLSIVSLVAVAVIAEVELSDAPRACIAVGAGTIEPGSAPSGSEPWHADLHVDFTDDPAYAVTRIALADSPGATDFIVAGHSPDNNDNGCGMTAATQPVSMKWR
jgi:hypothetical protein